ncbi:MAG: alkaline phosphatase [Bacteroidetes bacterium]|nr:MAG: alkaline phosphatase [Bacteroidota bacterium]
MGLAQITAGMYRNGNRLHLEDFKVVGLHKTYSASNLVTDSAAGATAFACGVKTYNGAIGVDPDTAAVTTLLEEAEAKGMATGLAATSTIVHATPAAFIAHVKERHMYEDIADWFLKNEVDLFVGGGLKYFTARKDGRNLVNELKDKGYIVRDWREGAFGSVTLDPSVNFGFFTAEGDPPRKLDGRDDYLIEVAEKAPAFLQTRSDKGFFLMIEGSQIDWGGHALDGEYIVSEMIEFDEAVGRAIEFAKKDGHTLVVVTADHETGGFSINPGSTMDTTVAGFSSFYDKEHTKGAHTAVMVPVFAYGPGAELFRGIYENTAIHDKIRQALGWE